MEPPQLEGLKQEVQKKFAEVATALKIRETLLLRQIDVIASSQKLMAGRAEEKETDQAKEIQFLAEQEDLLLTIRNFGRFQLDNMNLALQDVYLKNEDYITPANDHETMYKCLQQKQSLESETVESSLPIGNEEEEQTEAIVVDFSKNKSLIEHNAKHMNESIINITLQEAKELIRKAKVKRETPIPPLNLEELDDELESSIAEAVSSLSVGRESPVQNTKSSQTCIAEDSQKKSKKNRFKPKITINNCNGTINLRNISSLTINCATEESVSAAIPLQMDAEEETKAQSGTLLNKYTQNAQTSQKTPTNTTAVTVIDCSSTGNTTPTTATTASSSNSNYSSNTSSRSQSKKHKNKKSKSNENISTTTTSCSAGTQPPTSISTNTNTTNSNSSVAAYPYEVEDDDDGDGPNVAVTCDFYNRLLNEIKNSLKEKSKRTVDNSHYLRRSSSTSSTAASQAVAADSLCGDVNSNVSPTTSTVSTAASTTTTTQPGKRLVLKNFENLKIILEANSDEETSHPVQIEQWLAEIISETDLEPMQNTDILEHSKIHDEGN